MWQSLAVPARACWAARVWLVFLVFPLGAVGAQTPASPSVSPGTIACPVPLLSGRIPTRSPDASLFGLNLYGRYLAAFVPADALTYPADTIGALARAKARTWLTSSDTTIRSGPRLDALSQLYLAAGDDSRAIAIITQRLADGTLATRDRAHTLALAASAFLDSPDSNRARRGADYLAQLDALGRDAAPWRFVVRERLINTAYARGDAVRVWHYARDAYAILHDIPYELRENALDDALFLRVADALFGTPGGRARVDSLAIVLRSAADAPAEYVARDSTFAFMAGSINGRLRKAQALIARLGTPAPALVANYWVNMPIPTSAMTSGAQVPDTAVDAGTLRRLPLADGKIRLLEFGDKGCPACMEALPGMMRLRDAVPAGVEILYVTSTTGAWGGDFVGADVEAKNLTRFYRVAKQYALPIVLWAGAKIPNEDGGLVPFESPNNDAYAVQGTPTFVIVDGRGIIRHILVGYSRAVDRLLLTKLQYYAAEARAETAAATSSAP